MFFFGFCAQIGRLAGSPYSESPIFSLSIRSHRNPKKNDGKIVCPVCIYIDIQLMYVQKQGATIIPLDFVLVRETKKKKKKVLKTT